MLSQQNFLNRRSLLKTVTGILCQICFFYILYNFVFVEKSSFLSSGLYLIKNYLGINFIYLVALFFSSSFLMFGWRLKYQPYLIFSSILLTLSFLNLLGGLISSVFKNTFLISGIAGFATEQYLFYVIKVTGPILMSIKILLISCLFPLTIFFLLISLNLNFENLQKFYYTIKIILYYCYIAIKYVLGCIFRTNKRTSIQYKHIINKKRKAIVSKKNITKSVSSADTNVSFKLPPISLLYNAPVSNNFISKSEMERNAKSLETILSDYRVFGRITNFIPGPVVTLYEFEPNAGIKTSSVVNLEPDIARTMSSMSSVRIAVVRGKNAIGIELPNLNRKTVYIRHQLLADNFQHSNFALPISLGQDSAGRPVCVDLSKMPHLLVAGTTGSGKSVGINAFILSLLYKFTPYQCRFIMIDPKQLELSTYNGIPHLLTPVLVKPELAVGALKWIAREMDNRYSKLTELGAKNIVSFNEKIRYAKKNGKQFTKIVKNGDGTVKRQILNYEELPYIVVIIDEVSDLMMTAGKDVEAVILRLAQLGRASGVHLILATQRPSVNVITGIIKANIPTRISFKLPTITDSKTILDSKGAEQLLGNGDMLYMAEGRNLLRVHGSFVSENDVENVAKFWKNQKVPGFIDNVLTEEDLIAECNDGKNNSINKLFSSSGKSGNLSDEELYKQAVDLVLNTGRTSSSFVQRSFSIGYNKAANIIERMEREGILSPPDHVQKRTIIKKV